MKADAALLGLTMGEYMDMLAMKEKKRQKQIENTLKKAPKLTDSEA